MLSESVLIAILAFIVIMCFDHRKWRKAMSAGFVESTIQTTDLFSQATDHLAFIADCMDEQQGAPPPAAAEGMPSMDPKSIITHLLMKKVAMSLDHGSEAQQERTISEEKVE